MRQDGARSGLALESCRKLQAFTLSLDGVWDSLQLEQGWR